MILDVCKRSFWSNPGDIKFQIVSVIISGVRKSEAMIVFMRAYECRGRGRGGGGSKKREIHKGKGTCRPDCSHCSMDSRP